MTKTFDVQVVGLNEENVLPFGRLISPQLDKEPNIQGDGWQCWYPLGYLAEGRKLSIGMVLAQPGDKCFKAMEKHPYRSEWVFAVDKPYIQPLALSHPSDDNKPGVRTAVAFLIKPGQGIIITEGIWHAPGIAPSSTPALYGFVLGETQLKDEEELGLVPFGGGETIRCIN